MVDVFISYRSPDRARSAKIAKSLEEEALSVWWDQDLRGQVYSVEIGAKLVAASTVLALVSPSWSIFTKGGATGPVLHEIDRAGRRLIVAIVESVRFEDLPMPMGAFNALNLVGWDGNRLDPEWRKLVARCFELCGRRQLDQEVPARLPAVPPVIPAQSSAARQGNVTAEKIGVVIQDGNVNGNINIDQRD